MNWNSLTITANVDFNNTLTPIPNLNVTFVLYDGTNHLYYYFDKTTNANGVAVLPSSNSIIQEETQVAVQTENERGGGGYDSKNKETGGDRSNYNTGTIDNTSVASISNWFVTAEYHDRVISSELYNMQTTSGVLNDRLDGEGNPKAQTTKIKIKVSNNGTILNAPAYITYWQYSSSPFVFYEKGTVLTTSHSDGYYYTLMGMNENVDSIVLHAYYNGSYNIDETYRTFTVGSTENTITIPLTGTGGYFFNINDKNYHGNFDTLFHYIGKDVSVYPIKMKIANETISNIYYNQNLASKLSFTGKTGHCNTRYLMVQSIATAITDSSIEIEDIRPTYESSTTKYDIFGYRGGIISVTTYIPRIKYMFETPFVYDTAIYNGMSESQIANPPVYNLPNTDININWNTWNNTMSYSNQMTSNISAITIVNDDIVNTVDQTNMWFYDCLAGRNVTGEILYGNTIKCTFSKHHYYNNTYPLILSAYQMNSYSLTGDTIRQLYVTRPDFSQNPIELDSDKLKVITLEREEDAVFRRKDFVDYVKGFGFTYYGEDSSSNDSSELNGNNSSQNEEENEAGTRAGRINYTGYSLVPIEKCIPSKNDFYNESSSSLEGGEIATNLTDYINNYIPQLAHGTEYVTSYVKTLDIFENYLNNNHCYVMEETFIPVTGEGKSYLYFTNRNNGAPSGYEDMNLEVGVSLNKYGNPYDINLEYSFDSNPWKTYVIGRTIYLPPGKTVFFRAINTNQNFSKDVDNFYYFDIDNTLTNENSEVSYDTLIKSNSVSFAKYDVIVGGKISALLVSTMSENAQLNIYGFYDLFGNIKLTNAKDLTLDLRSIPSHGYEYMFQGTHYLGAYNISKGPSIMATSIREYGMNGMFMDSHLTTLNDNTLYLQNLASHCFYKMFERSYYNETLTITAGNNANVASVFKEMFNYGQGTKAKLSITNITVFGTDFCKKMFYYSETQEFSDFANPIDTIGQESFYEAYRYSKITAVTFTLQNTIWWKGCMYMCADLRSKCTINDLHLDAEKTDGLCYAYMFQNSDKVYGNFDFHVGAISPSGCTHMFDSAGKIGNGLDVYSNFDGEYICKLGPTYIENCSYSYMFYNSGLKIVPKLPATDLYLNDIENGAQECYSHMFDSSNVTGFADAIKENTTGNTAGTEVVLNAPVLPDKCYEYMFANTNIKRILYVITTGLTQTGFKSCSYMFYNTQIQFVPRDTYIHLEGDISDYVTIRHLGQTTFASNSNHDYDNIRHLYRDAIITGGKIKVLTGLKINRTLNLFGGYNYKGSSESSCVNVNDCYCVKEDTPGTPDNGYRYYEKHLTSTNPRTFSDYDGVQDDYRIFTEIGRWKEYSYNQTSDSLEGYSYRNINRYVYLNATVLGDYCYEYMFANCPKLYAGHNFLFNGLTNTSEGCFSHMFYNSYRLRSMQPSLTGLNLSNKCFESMYAHCGRWETKRPQHHHTLTLRRGLEIAGDYHYRFSAFTPGDASLDYVYLKKPSLSAENDDEYSEQEGIWLKPSYDDRVEVKFTKPLYTDCFKNMFSECRAIKTPKLTLDQTTLANGCYDGMLCGCTLMVSGATLKTSSSSPAKERCFKNMYKFCLNLINPTCTALSPTTLEANCYEGMYSYCASLSAAPYLPAITLSNGSYNYMFYAATNGTNRYTFECSFTGSAIVNGSSTYSDNLKLRFYLNTEGCYFKIDNYEGDYTTKVKLRQNGTSTEIGDYITYYQESNDLTNFEGDFFTGLKNALCQNQILRPFYENATIEGGHDNNEQLFAGYPYVLTIGLHLNEITSIVENYMDNYYEVGSYHRERGLFGTVIEKITTLSPTTHSNTYLTPTSGVSYIMANLSSTQTGNTKTKQWVYRLEDNPDGEFVRTINGPTTRGEDSVPSGWDLHT